MKRPTLWNRLLAHLHGEVPADTLEAYRRASLAVYDQLDYVEAHRQKSKADGLNAWTVPPATQAEILCAWNAFVLQNLGDSFLEADYASQPETTGFVPPITADQVLAFYSQVEGWLNRAQQAHYNPDYRLDVDVPAELPPWSEVQPCPDAHLRGMLEAMCSIRDHTSASILFLKEAAPPKEEDRQSQFHQIQQLYASAMTTARYAEDLHGSDPTQEVYERVEPHFKEAIEKFYTLGQLLAMPQLADKYADGYGEYSQPHQVESADLRSRRATASSRTKRSSKRLALPNERGFNIWCLTDIDCIERWKRDPKAIKAVKDIWRYDPDPVGTLRIKSEIDAAFARGDIQRAEDRYGKPLGHFFCCPWSPVYQVVRPVTIAGKRLRTMQQFTLEVSAEGCNLGFPFRRELIIGTFTPTTKIEYCDPNEAPKGDEH